MENRKTLTARVRQLIPELAEEDILLPVDFNLTPTAKNIRTDGIAFLTKDRIPTVMPISLRPNGSCSSPRTTIS